MSLFALVDPVQHAMSLIESCGGDLDAARNIATDNAMNNLCDDKHWFYWSSVRSALMPSSKPEDWN